MWTPELPLHVLADWLRAFFDGQERVQVLGWRNAGTTTYVRGLASASCDFAVVHVQHDASGGDTYDAGTFVSRTEVDCRSSRQFDVDFVRNGVNRYHVWLIPRSKDADGNLVTFDGVTGEDRMAYIGAGV